MSPKEIRVRTPAVCLIVGCLLLTLWLPLSGVGEEPSIGAQVPGPETNPTGQPLPWWETTGRDLDRNHIEDLLEAHSGPYRGLFVDFDRYPGHGLQQSLIDLGLDLRFVDGGINTVLTGQATWQQVQAISRLPHVVFINEEQLIFPRLDISVPAIKVKPSATYSPVAWDDDLDGTGINIAIVDTGVDDDHDFLAGSLIAGVDFTDNSPFASRDGTADPDDNDGHGTHVASTALGEDPNGVYSGVAPKARLVDVKVIDIMGSVGGTLLQGMNWTLEHKDDDWDDDGPVNNGIQIVSISAGSGADDDGTAPNSRKGNELVENGVVVVAAVGNGGTDGIGDESIDTPAAGDWVIGVGNMDDRDTIERGLVDEPGADEIHSSSNYGPREDDGDEDTWDELKPDVSAPGTNIQAAAHTFGSDGAGNSNVATKTGTSMSTPHVSGLVALMLQAEPELQPGPGSNPVQSRLRELSELWGDISFPELSDHYNVTSGHGYVDGYNTVHSEAPDLVIIQTWSEPATAVEGDTVSLFATVRNDGNLAMDSAEIHFFDGPAIDEELLDSTTVQDILPEAQRTVSIQWVEPTVANHSLEVVIKNSEPDERSVRNNNRTFYLEVTEPPLDPDLRMESVYLNDPEPSEGQPLTVMAMISNVGQQASSSALVSIYEGDPDDGGTLLGSQELGALEPEEQLEVSVPWDGPDEGQYRLFALVEDVEPLDANENNNRIFITVDVAAKPYDPDLTISMVDITWEPELPEGGEEVVFEVRVHNIGQEQGNGRVTLNLGGSRLDRWSDVDIPGEDHVTLSTSWTATSGEHELQVVIDQVDNEADTDNNEVMTLINVAAGGADYQILKLEVPGRIVEGQEALLSVVIRNIGDSDGVLVRADFYMDGSLKGYQEKSTLERGRITSLDLAWNPTPGTHELKVILTSDEDIDPSNNEQTLQLEVLFPLTLALASPFQAGEAGDLMLFEVELDNLRLQTISGTLSATAQGLEGLSFGPSQTATVSFEIPALSSAYIDLEVMVPEDVDPGNHTLELEARVSGLSTYLEHEGAVIVPLVITPMVLEMRPGETQTLSIGLFNPLLEEATFTLSGEDLPSKASLTINGFSDTVLLNLEGQERDMKAAEIELSGSISPGDHDIRFTLIPTDGDETYSAVVTLTVLPGDGGDGGDGLLPSLTMVGGLLTVALVAVAVRTRRRDA